MLRRTSLPLLSKAAGAGPPKRSIARKCCSRAILSPVSCGNLILRSCLIRPGFAAGAGARQAGRLQKGTHVMRALGLKVVTVVICVLVGAVVIHSLVYLSIDPGSLSAQMPVR
jgi:hypothetical protein